MARKPKANYRPKAGGVGMGMNGNCACGMHMCGKCAPITLLFGILFLVAGFGLWNGHPDWFNGWTLVGVFLAALGASAMFMKD